MAQTNPLNDAWKAVRNAVDQDAPTLGDLADALGPQGFGPLLVVLAALVILPTGMIPFLPAVVGLALLLLSGQLILGWHTPWLPQKLRSMTLSQRLVRRGLDMAGPTVRRLSRWLKPRAEILATGQVALRAAAVLISLAAVGMIGVGFVPFVPLLMGLPVLCIGLALTIRDGWLMTAGFAAIVPSAIVILRQIG